MASNILTTQILDKGYTINVLLKKLGQGTLSRILQDIEQSNNVLMVFTDGGALKNGKRGCIAGYSVYFDDPKYSDLEYTGLVPDTLVHTNNTGELSGLLKAYQTLSKMQIDKNVIIYTDSMYGINCLDKWSKAWVKNGWKNSKGGCVKNQELIQEILKTRSEISSMCSLKHIKSHQPEPRDRDSLEWRLWNGNNICDKNITSLLCDNDTKWQPGKRPKMR